MQHGMQQDAMQRTDDSCIGGDFCIALHFASLGSGKLYDWDPSTRVIEVCGWTAVELLWKANVEQ